MSNNIELTSSSFFTFDFFYSRCNYETLRLRAAMPRSEDTLDGSATAVDCKHTI